ncbi:hypothetical protein [Streptomyces sp. NPDC006668]|uniref:hypothetical protein n=1 Tax=Streptomyces sp. NPDC006668 TaxID=3156903 RepID=UPI0033CD6893
MRRTTTALLAATVLALAGCSSSGDSQPQPTVTVTKTPKLSAAEQLQTCVDAWAKAYHASTDPTETPAPCNELSENDQTKAQFDGLMKRNKENIQAGQDCLTDPTCTSLPVAP